MRCIYAYMLVLTSNETSDCSVSPLKSSMLIVMMPWLKKRTCRKIVSFWENTYRRPSDVLVSKISLSCGKNSIRPCSSNFITSFCPVESLIRLESIAKSNRTVSADIFTSLIDNSSAKTNFNNYRNNNFDEFLITKFMLLLYV